MTTSVMVFEILSGLQIMPAGRRQSGLSQVFTTILERMDHRVAAFDDESAHAARVLPHHGGKEAKSWKFVTHDRWHCIGAACQLSDPKHRAICGYKRDGD
jgi:hypothetical protein